MNFSLISAAPTTTVAAAVFPRKQQQQQLLFKVMKEKKVCCGRDVVVNCKAFLFDTEDPVLKQALKEPVAFVGGMFAGIMRLDLNEDPLKDWLSRTVQASDAGISDHSKSKSTPQQQEEEVPQQIQIE